MFPCEGIPDDENLSFYFWLYKEHEGVTWIRGHHDPDSADAKALIAANALGEGTTFFATINLTK